MCSAFAWTVVLFACLSAAAQPRDSRPQKIQQPAKNDSVVFRIGSFDRSSAEFAPGSPSRPVDFVVGQSNPAQDWYAEQPAELANAAAAANNDIAAAPRAIQFTLQLAPAGAYRLRVSLLIESASVPALRVAINGKFGMFYLHPALDYSNGDQGDSFYPAYSHADVEYEFPGSALREGVNILSFQAIEEANHAVPDAGLTYDAIELDRVSGGLDRAATSARLFPTIFFRQEQGQMKEEVEAVIRYGERVRPGSDVKLTIGGSEYNQTSHGGQDFGEERLDFLVSAFPAESRARLQWDIDGRRAADEQIIDPQKQWTIFVVPNIHLDVGYSDFQPKVAAIQSRAIDEAMDMTARHPDFRFSLDGEWDLEQFLKTRSDAQRERAIAAIQHRQLFVPAQYANLLTGFPTAETLIRSLYPSAEFSRIHNAPFNYANITDVPSWSWSYASILAAAGIHYLAGGSNNYRAPVLLQGRLNEASPMWWEGPDGQRVLLWYSRIYQQMQMLFGLPPVLDAGRETLPLFLQMYEHPGYGASATMLYGTQVENTDLFPQQSELAQEWNSIYAYPHLQYSGFVEALHAIQEQSGPDIPVIRGDGGPYWEDGIASDAQFAGMERWNEGRAPTAEKLATLTSLLNPQLRADTTDLDRMWKNMVLMDEHTWDSWNSISSPGSIEATGQLAVKDQYAVNASALIDFVARNSMASLANAIPADPGSVIVFNSLNWKRDGIVSLDLGKGQELVNLASGQQVPVEVLSSGSDYDHVRFVARDIPAMGYRVFATRAASGPPAAAPSADGTVLESDFYRVMLDPATGAISSIYDKQAGRELVNAHAPWRFGQYLYVSGGDKAPNTILQYSQVYPKPDLVVHPAEQGSLQFVRRTPYGWVARMESHDVNTPSIVTEIQLFDHEKKIELTEEVDKKEVTAKEAVYFAFPFAMSHPQFQYEIQNGVVDPAKDMYPGAGHEWFSVQHWVSVQQDGVSATVMPLDAALVTLGDINRGEWPLQFGTRTGTIFSYAMNNYWDTNYRAEQGGHFRFHYVITSAASTDAQALSRMGWEEITPLEADTVTSQDKALAVSPGSSGGAELPAEQHEASNAGPPWVLSPSASSFLDVTDPGVLLEAWKPASDGNGTILRFLDLAGTTRTVSCHTPLLDLTQAWQTDAVERNEASLSLLDRHAFQFTIHPHEIVTLRIVGSDVVTPPVR